MLERSVANKILEDLSFFPVVGIVGPRQAGKTTLVKAISNNIKGQVLYLDLQLNSDKRKLQDAETYLKLHQGKCVIIDEIQLMPELFPLIRALVDIDRKPARFIILGSASPEVIKNSAESLAGRISYTELSPFSWLEVSDDVTMNQHWLLGGFPEALLSKRDDLSYRWLKSFVENFIYRDLRELGHQISPSVVEDMLKMLSSLNGQILNRSDLSRSIGLSQPTISRYLDLLEGGFVISRLKPYFANISKRIVKLPKLYIRDSGVLHYLLNLRNFESLLGNVAVGASWEGYVIEQVRRVVGNECEMLFYRTHKGAECDLLLILPSGEKICVEIKRSASAKISRGLYEVIKDIKPQYSYIVIPEGESYPNKDGIITIDLDSFLKEILKKVESI